jgi:opacity protein-like surface antigen
MVRSIVLAVLFLGMTGLVNAEPADTLNSDATLKEIGLYSGWGTADTGDDNASKDYDTVYIGARFGFNLKKWLKLDKMPGMFLFMVEPFVNPVIKPSSNYEVGCGTLLKYAFPVTKRFYPYIEGGTGGIYISEKTRKQGSHMNFVDQAGAGLYYFIDDTWALNAGYRFRHISNLGIKKPNGGIDSHFAILGASRFF